MGSLCAAPMAAGPDGIRGLNPIHSGELGALTKPRVCSIPVSTGLHHAVITLPKLKNFFDPLAGLSRRSCSNRHRSPIIFLPDEQPPPGVAAKIDRSYEIDETLSSAL
jgi:hypothetical protein